VAERQAKEEAAKEAEEEALNPMKVKKKYIGFFNLIKIKFSYWKIEHVIHDKKCSSCGY
jgi:hypothetical protein